jgi:MFS family permease
MAEISSETARAVEAERRRWHMLLAAVASVTVFGFALGEMFPLLSLIMEKAGMSPAAIGANTAMQPVGVLLSGLIIPPLSRRFGPKRVLLAAAAASAFIVLLYPLTPIYWGWFLLRVLQGTAIAALFSISEAWIIQSADGEYRSRVIAIYSSILAGSFGLGPALIAATGIEGFLPFGIGAAVLLAAMLPVVSVQVPAAVHNEDDGAAASIWGLFHKAPVLLLSVMVYALFDAACLGLLPVYALRKGLTQETAALTLTILVLGNVALQFPIGWLGDVLPKRAVMTACVAVTAVFTALLPMAMGTPLQWVVLIIIGSSSSGIYTMALSEVGERFKGSELVTATAATASMWGIGALAGALLMGGTMQLFGPDGFPYSTALVMAAFTAVIVWRERWKKTHTVGA